ncbi:hypothetical protein RB595_002087 [Gaeumannomyces hyphopodioides]
MSYTIYASTAVKPTGAYVGQVLSGGNDTDNFVAALGPERKLILAAVPKAAPTDLDAADETAQWFAQMDAVASVLVTGPEAAKVITSFHIDLVKPVPLSFSSDPDVLVSAFGGPTSKIPAPGLAKDGAVLTCGLDFDHTFGDTKEIKANVGGLFQFAGIPSARDFLPDKIADMSVSLKKSDGAAEKARRNALWFTPADSYQTIMRLQFSLGLAESQPLQTVLGGALPGFTLKSAEAVTKRKVSLAKTSDGPMPLIDGQVTFAITCSVKARDGPEVTATAAVEFASSTVTLTFLFDSEDPLDGILLWLAERSNEPTLKDVVRGLLAKGENDKPVVSKLALRRVSVGLVSEEAGATEGKKGNPSLASFSFDIEALTTFGSGDDQPPAAFLLSYSWNKDEGGIGTIRGQFWGNYDTTSAWELSPSEEEWTVLLPSLNKQPAKFIYLAHVLPGITIGDIPDCVPSKISRAYLELSDKHFAIGGAITAGTPSLSKVPQPQLGELALDAKFDWDASKKFTLDLQIGAALYPSEHSKHPAPALLRGALHYEDVNGQRIWRLGASLSGLYASTLAEFFDEDSKDHVLPLIDSIMVKDLTVDYTYVSVAKPSLAGGTSDGSKPPATVSAASELKIRGTLLISVFELALSYDYKAGSWTFVATVNPQDKAATIGDVIMGLLDLEDGDLELPAFVANTPFAAKADALRLSIVKQKKPAAITDGRPLTDLKPVPSSFQLLLRLRFGGDTLGLSLAFAQLQSTDWGADARPKRLVKVALLGLPAVDVPLVGNITQPFDQLYFLWVQDPPPKTASAKPRVAGLTRKDILQINEGFEADNQLIVKDKFKEQNPADLLLGAGCHVAVITKNDAGEKTCLLSYEFMKPKPATARPALLSADMHALAAGADKAEDDSGSSATAPFKKKAGPLSISNIGLKYKDKKIRIQFDAMFDLGPLAFSLIGFSIGVDIKTLDDLPSLDVQIEGLAAVFNKPPLTIAGIIRHGNTGELDYYAGGLVVGFVPYQFMAAGFYGSATPKDGAPFTSIFVFAKLNGPLITLEFAEISGITGGFGYNSSVRLPRPEEIADFPFVAPTALSGADDVLDVLIRLTDPGPAGWFKPQNDTYWFAAGMKISAFQMISLDAVVLVQFGTSVKLAIFGVAVADIPTAASPLKYAHVELGIGVVVDFDYGVLKAEAQLSPRSYVLHPDCHLQGGAALYYWFDAPRADPSTVGQFVFTLGGFHQAFEVPVGYPNPPRLGISWQVGRCLSISGQAYFAITPKACMGGGRLKAVFQAGPIKAWFDAWADFLINYKPFHFMAEAGISVGCEFEVDLGFVSFTLSIELGARLYLWGPPVAGRVHVDFWVASFDIDFGDSDADWHPVGLVQFYELVLQAGEKQPTVAAPKALMADDAEEEIVSPMAASAVPAVPIRPKNEGHVFLPQSGLLNPSEGYEKEPNPEWVVRAGTFSFVIGCKMAVNSVRLDRVGDFDPEAEDDGVTDLLMSYGSPDAGLDVFGKPMRLLSPMESTLTFQISQAKVAGGQARWRVEEHIKSVPRGLWSKYKPGEDPTGGNNNVGELLESSDGSMPLLMGVLVTAPKPIKSRDNLPVYNIADATLVRLTAEKVFPKPAASNADWEPAEPPKDAVEHYGAVLEVWKKPTLGSGGRRGFVDSWASAFGWGQDKMAGKMGAMPKKIRSRFEKLYVAAPLMTA